MSDYNARIQRVVQELASLQRDLNQLLMDSAADDAAVQFAEAVDANALRDLKSVTDQLRHFLWFYLQAVFGTSESSARTMQLLRQAHKSSTSHGQTSPLTFLQRLNAMAEYALVHYVGDPTVKPN
jgi:hypothetical protein